MLCGKPVIGTTAIGMPMELVNGKSGYFIRPGDPIQLAEKIFYLLNNPSKAKELGAQGRQIVENEFDASKIVGRLLDVFKEE
jgi:glycosyltransferase involved in cell wall biosynthesis